MEFAENAGLSREMLAPGEKLEPLSAGVSVITGEHHTFNTDTILLADFSLPRPGAICADFGTGCGTIPLLWCARAKPAFIYAVELQPSACGLAERSVRHNGLEDRVRVVRGDIKALRSGSLLPHDLDLIACNPPYGRAGAGLSGGEEKRRIARHEVACSFSDIAVSAAALLRWGGRFCCCLRPERLCDAVETLRRAGIEPKRLRFVQQRRNKPPFLFLLQGSRGGKPGLTVEPVLLVESENGGFSEEMLKIYGDYKEGRA